MNKPTGNQAKEDALTLLLKEGISKGSHPEFRICSGSMSPLLKIGDKISIKEVTPENLACGDIIVYKERNRLITHRFLYRKGSDYLVTKGDALPEIDEAIPREALVGRIYLIEKNSASIYLENRIWRFTNLLLGKAFLNETLSVNKNLLLGLMMHFESKFYGILALTINQTYSRLTREKEDSLALERKFLKIASKKELGESETAILKDTANQNLNWEWLLLLAEYNSIAPLAYANLSKLKGSWIPEEVLERLKDSYTESFLKTAPVYNDLSKLLQEFNSLGIKNIILKGCSLAELIYEDFSLRPMKDVDILVKKENWPKITEVLGRLGYKSKDGFDPLLREELIGIPVDWHACFENNRGTRLEFKFHIFILDFPDFADIDKYWQEALPATAAGAQTLSLSIEDQILHLACRLISVSFRNLLWFCDLREFLKHFRDKIDWQKLVARARAKKVTALLYYSLLILQEELGADLPEEVLISLRPNIFRRRLFKLFYASQNMLFRIPAEPNFPYPQLALCIVFGKVKLNAKDLKRFFLYMNKLIFPSKEYINYRYQKEISSGQLRRFYYLRAKRLIFRLISLGKIVSQRLI